jgi:hypothetical protein
VSAEHGGSLVAGGAPAQWYRRAIRGSADYALTR